MASGCASSRDGARFTLQETRRPVRIGDTAVDIVVHDSGRPGLTLFNLHDNEDTSVEAALQVVRARGGRVIEVQHVGERNVTFHLGDATYTFDPNRIFTPAGIVATLDDLSRSTPEAAEAVEAFAEALLESLDLGGDEPVITLHNNTELNYSVFSYGEGADYATDAEAVHLADEREPDNFFFVTERAFYDPMRAAGFNVVLQDNATVADDGSLSVYTGRLGVPYINVEAQHGHVDQQAQMIEFLYGLLVEG